MSFHPNSIIWTCHLTKTNFLEEENSFTEQNIIQYQFKQGI